MIQLLTENGEKMFNIVIGTHGQLGEALVATAEMIIGKMEKVYWVSLLPSKSFEDFMKETDQLFTSLEGPTIAFVDLFGGTPSNVFAVLSKKYGFQLISGINLPVLIDLYLKRDTEDITEELISTIIAVINESVIHINKRLEEI